MDTLTTAPVVTGTSLAILQAYPLGTLRVCTPDGDGTVIGFMYNKISERYCPVVDLDISRDKIGMGYSVVDCVPYLLPISALCGRAPRFHKAMPVSSQLKKLLEYAAGREVEADYFWAEPVDGTSKLNRIYMQYESDGERFDASFWSDGTALVANNMEQCLDYLRSEGYALPVNGRPLVEGVDFIPKTNQL